MFQKFQKFSFQKFDVTMCQLHPYGSENEMYDDIFLIFDVF